MAEKMQITDAQIHLWAVPGAPSHHVRDPYPVERALREMDEAGVDRAVNCPAIWDPTANAYGAEAAEARPDRFRTMAWFPVDGTVAPATLDELLARPGVVGLRMVLYAPQAGSILSSGSLDWLWRRAQKRDFPVALMVMPDHLPLIGQIAATFPGVRLALDHLAIGPFEKLPQAASHLDELLQLASHPNISVKATGIVGATVDDYPFPSAHAILRRVIDVYGPSRTFWGTDITRQSASWTQLVTMFTAQLTWLRGDELEMVMGRGISDWLRWS
jgi:predicted TIM-barrel fold metal-dependent hydrolase